MAKCETGFKNFGKSTSAKAVLANKKNIVKAVDKAEISGIIEPKIKDDSISLKITQKKQSRHIKDYSKYDKGKSYITISEEETQRIVDEMHGKGKLLLDKQGNWKNRE